mgnify:CR=1 FL=1
MKTDKQLYELFSAQPLWIFELTGLKPPGRCELQSIVLKAIEQQADAVVVPELIDEPLTVVEFQFQDDPQIYTRVAIEMALVQQQQSMRLVQGVIFFRFPKHDPQTAPWSQIIHSYSLGGMLESLAERSPEHPLVAVFQPVLQSSEQALAAHAADYYHQIRVSDAAETLKQTMLDVFVNWLEQRLRDKGKEEIEQMLLGELPDLRDTASGRDLINIGRREGRNEGISEGIRGVLLSIIEERFGVVSKELHDRIDHTESIDTLKRLVQQVVKIESLDELKW